MKNFSNLYIFCFSSVLVLVVAAALSFTSLSLADRQKANIETERQQNILLALGVESTPADATQKYTQYITKGVVIKPDGSEVSGMNPKEVDLAKQNHDIASSKMKAEDRLLPFYEAKKDGKSFIVIPVRGAGLWGPIWGNVALEGDMNTIYGVTFDHKGETPGLGAEIATPEFQKQFQNKKLFDPSGTFTSILVEKAGHEQNDHTVDAISGGTLTSKGLEKMLKDSLEPYKTYFSQHKTN